MHSITILKASAVALLAALFVDEVVASTYVQAGSEASATRHRRHHSRRSVHRRRSGHCKPSLSSGSSSSDNSTGTRSSNSTGSTSQSSYGLKSSLISNNNVYVGLLPDDGDAGGSAQTMAELNAAIGGRSAAYGYYAQAHSGTTFDGSQLLSRLADVKACNCVFQPAVMPTGGWQGLTQDDNSQAIAIANVMKKFTDEGIEVWLRFAHEVNWYQTDGTYSGNADDFKQGWATVAAAIKQIAPTVKMFWTPNVASMESYAQYEPYDMSTVDVVGVDFYPKSLGSFVSTLKPFHDKYAINGRKFAMGETGLGYAGAIGDRIQWLQEIINAKSQMSELISVSWFNYQKGYDFKVADPNADNSAFKALMST